MVDDKRQKVDWRSLLVGVVLGSVITVGASWITPLDLNKAQNSVIDTVKYFLTLESGFGETQVITTSTKKDDKTTITNQTHPRKTLWDWLELVGTLAVPLVIAILGLWFQQKENKRAEEQDHREREIAQGNLAEEAIQKYLDDMAKLLLNKELKKELFPNVNDILNPSGYYNPVRDVARTQTITILRRLQNDKEFQGRIITFLKDAGIYGFILKNAHLSGINLSGAYLSTNLQGADLKGADLKGADLKGAVLLNAKNLTPKQIKSACNWDEAIYKGEWHWEQKTETWKPNNDQDKQKNINYKNRL